MPAILYSVGWVRDFYAGGGGPGALLESVLDRIAAGDPAAFIRVATPVQIAAQIAALPAEPNSLPLWGVPCAVKDNIDVVGFETTAACPAFAYTPTHDAAVVAKLRAAGAIIVGKTNLDQFATGLNGTRSPYGAPRCVFDADYVSGGSSSGSAVAVASGCVSFALGTDTAGSGRVPASFNNIVGIKPTPGLVSSRGMVPACRSLDCTSIFALTVADGAAVRRVIQGYDAGDPYAQRATPAALPTSGIRLGVLAAADRQFFGDDAAEALYDAAIARAAALGCAIVAIDYAPFAETAALLYAGPWVAERYAAFEGFGIAIADMDPSVAAITQGGSAPSAADAFRGAYRLAELKRRAEAEWAKADMLLLPSSPTIARVDAMRADPIALNSRFGTYTNFFNLMGLAGIAVPAGFRDNGLPFGVTLAAPAFTDAALEPLAAALHAEAACGAGIDRAFAVPAPSPVAVPDDRLHLAVVGAHLSGMALNHELLAIGATRVRSAETMPEYRLFLLDTIPPKPGLIREPEFVGPGIKVEIWAVPPQGFARFVEAIPGPLGIGKLRLRDGSSVSGFLCEAAAVTGRPEITGHGGWRAFVASREPVPA